MKWSVNAEISDYGSRNARIHRNFGLSAMEISTPSRILSVINMLKERLLKQSLGMQLTRPEMRISQRDNQHCVRPQ